MDKETEALFYAIWFPFLLELAKVYIFPRDVYSSLGDDIEVQLKDFIIIGQPIPNTIDMANQIRGHCKMGTFAALETVIHEFLNVQLVRLWIEYERTGVNRSNWQGGPNLLQSTLQPADSTNTENYKNFDQGRAGPSRTVAYRQIIDSGFVSVATTSTREDQTVPNQANINVLVNELPDGRLQIGRQGLIADLNPGPSTSRCSTSAAIDKYEPIWLPSPLWPATVDQFIAGFKGFLSVLAGRKFYYVPHPQETPILRPYTRQVNMNKIREEYEYAILVDRSRRGECTSAEKERIAELKPRVKQNSNTKIKDEKRKKELQIRQELFKALCKETRRCHTAMNSLNLRIQAIPDELLRSKLEGTVRAIRHFVESRREENKDTLVPGKVTDNKYKLQMVSWKGEYDILRELRELLERLIHMEPSTELSQEVTMGLKRRNQPQVDEPATKKPAAQVNNLLLCNVSCPEEDTINEDTQLLEPNTIPASSMFTEQGALPKNLLRPETTVDLTNIAITLEPEDEGGEEDYAESSLRAQQQEEGDHHKNNIWDVPLDNNLGGRWDTATSNMSYPQVPEEKDYDYDWREDWW